MFSECMCIKRKKKNFIHDNIIHFSCESSSDIENLKWAVLAQARLYVWQNLAKEEGTKENVCFYSCAVMALPHFWLF